MRYSSRRIDVVQFSSFGKAEQYYAPSVRKEMRSETVADMQMAVHGNLVGHIIGAIAGEKVSEVIKR